MILTEKYSAKIGMFSLILKIILEINISVKENKKSILSQK